MASDVAASIGTAGNAIAVFVDKVVSAPKLLFHKHF